MSQIRILVVDDSYFMRQALTKLLTTEDTIVIDTAKNGKEAVEKANELMPDIITMDIEMPVMTGIQALEQIMQENPLPVLMLSTLTSEGAEATMEALSLGAVDFITKKAAFKEMDSIQDEILSKIRALGKNSNIKNQMIRQRLLRNMKNRKDSTDSMPSLPSSASYPSANKADTSSKSSSAKRKPFASEVSVIGIGISTGGPKALMDFVRRLPAEMPVPIIIVQHMPADFTRSLAERLDKASKIKVYEAKHGDRIMRGTVYLAPGGKQMTISKGGVVKVSAEPDLELFKPSVNVMMNSLVDVFHGNIVGIMMTGMGNDGSVAFKKLHNAGGYVIAQSLDTCVVGGMPKAVIDAGIADEILSANDIPDFICSIFGLRAEPII